MDIFNAISERSDGQFKVEIERGNPVANRALAAYGSNPAFLCNSSQAPTSLGARQIESAFVNRSSQSVEIFEIGSNGQRFRIREIPPGARLSVTSQSGQSWEVREKGGSCLAIFASPNRDVEFSIASNMADKDPGAFVKTYQCDDVAVPVVIAPNHGFAIIDGQFAVVRAKVAGRNHNIWGSASASISNDQLILKGGSVPSLNCPAR